ncbi:MAG TPA: class I SAM-dependent methyltransferase [Pyrinomonadaceae bacterium]|nr:class I SAM-dependent methyltransferase [Pyrinomonadaceae bacterium]
MAANSVERFSNRVANYVKYRPTYPPEVLRFLQTELNLRAASVVADIGSGTGISSKIFLENGCRVYGVEPNGAMRAAAEEFLRDFPNFRSVDGASENTTLADRSIDFVTAAQAFHWFEPVRTRAEFERILKPGGDVVLIWNERQIDTNEFLREYEKFLLDFGTDYAKVRHDYLPQEKLGAFFTKGFQTASFQNSQTFDFEGLKGRALSSSYMPSERDARYPEMTKSLLSIFNKHADNDRISISYDTNIYYGKL